MTNSTIKLVQKNIKKFREQKGYTQLKLSILASVSKDYITAIELGKRTPSIKRLDMIAKALGIETYKFFKNES
ncbi:helix-turn-helix transcriptional regulator [bacterium]|nr:helix-turn-helix transcriptional regulator [bacterium]